jgi:hypothetical protein
MRSGQTLFLVSAALFIGGIAFVIVGARAPRRASPAAVAVAPAPPLATIQQIMNAIVLPNATKVYNAVGYTSTKEGLAETAPKNDEEWSAIAASAAALVESGGLMTADGRRLDNGEWLRMTDAFITRSREAFKAATEKNKDGIFASGGDLNETCDRCHARYQRQ